MRFAAAEGDPASLTTANFRRGTVEVNVAIPIFGTLNTAALELFAIKSVNMNLHV